MFREEAKPKDASRVLSLYVSSELNLPHTWGLHVGGSPYLACFTKPVRITLRVGNSHRPGSDPPGALSG